MSKDNNKELAQLPNDVSSTTQSFAGNCANSHTVVKINLVVKWSFCKFAL